MASKNREKSREIFQKVLERLHKIEKAHGSILTAPEEDQDLQYIYRVYPRGKALNRENTNLARRYSYLRRLVDQGYPIHHLTNMTGLNKEEVLNYCEANGLQRKKIFKFIVCSPDMKIIYIDSIVDFVANTFKHKRMNNAKSIEYLEERNWQVKCKQTCWYKVPVGVRFKLKHMDSAIRKVDNLSYVYE